MSDRWARSVGPVLHATPFAAAVVAAIEQDNSDVVISDEGAYLRILVPDVCRLSCATIEEVTGVPVTFPGDLEAVMPSFSGRLSFDEYGAVWWLDERSQ